MGYVVLLPPGHWRSDEDEARWAELLAWHDSIGDLYRQEIYLSLTDAKFAARMQHSDYRARIEREHKARCDQVDAAVRAHLACAYDPDAGWPDDFELEWVPDDQAGPGR
ncbi:MAG: hypothetical protein AB7P12_15870 [Alphaproteobacteria bacterium]